MFEQETCGNPGCVSQSSSAGSLDESQKTSATATPTTASAQPSEESLSISSIRENDEVSEEVRNASVQSLREDNERPSTSSEAAAAAAASNLRSLADWENLFEEVFKEDGPECPAANIFAQMNGLFKKRLQDVETYAPDDPEVKLETYKEWTSVLLKFNESVVEDMDKLEKLMEELRIKKELLKYLEHSRDDLNKLIDLIFSAENADDLDFSGLELKTVNVEELLAAADDETVFDLEEVEKKDGENGAAKKDGENGAAKKEDENEAEKEEDESEAEKKEEENEGTAGGCSN